MYFNPFAALIPDEFTISQVKYQLTLFALENNDQETRQLIEKTLHDYFAKQPYYYFGCVCDANNNTPDIVEQNKLVLYFEFKTTAISKLCKYKMIIGPKHWNKKQAVNFSESELVKIYTSLEFEVEKLTD